MKRIAILTLLAMSAVPGSVRATAGESGSQPHELVRELQDFQNDSVLNAQGDQAQQRERVRKLAELLSKLDAKVWAEPRNARAAVIYVLIGGDPLLLRQLTSAGVSFAIDDRLIKGALAYGEHKDDKAIELLKLAREAGFRDFQRVLSDPDFRTVVEDPRFRELAQAK